jgi:hypothetical protein
MPLLLACIILVLGFVLGVLAESARNRRVLHEFRLLQASKQTIQATPSKAPPKFSRDISEYDQRDIAQIETWLSRNEEVISQYAFDNNISFEAAREALLKTYLSAKAAHKFGVRTVLIKNNGTTEELADTISEINKSISSFPATRNYFQV